MLKLAAHEGRAAGLVLNRVPAAAEMRALLVALGSVSG
jgi:hypothetical protein